MLNLISCSFSELLDLIDTHPYLTTLDPLLLQFCAQAATVDQYERLANKVPLFLLITAFVEECPRYSERQVNLDTFYKIM